MEDYNHLIYRIIKFGLVKEFFTFNELKEALSFDANELILVEKKFIYYHQDSDKINSNHLITLVSLTYTNPKSDTIPIIYPQPDYHNSQLSLLPNAIFQYNDLLEIIEARKNAEYAKETSNHANKLSRRALIATVIIGLVQTALTIIFGILQLS